VPVILTGGVKTGDDVEDIIKSWSMRFGRSWKISIQGFQLDE